MNEFNQCIISKLDRNDINIQQLIISANESNLLIQHYLAWAYCALLKIQFFINWWRKFFLLQLNSRRFEFHDTQWVPLQFITLIVCEERKILNRPLPALQRNEFLIRFHLRFNFLYHINIIEENFNLLKCFKKEEN